jgi:hypothetical protein
MRSTYNPPVVLPVLACAARRSSHQPSSSFVQMIYCLPLHTKQSPVVLPVVAKVVALEEAEPGGVIRGVALLPVHHLAGIGRQVRQVGAKVEQPERC